MKVTLLGTGCAQGTPKPGCDCKTCKEARKEGWQRKRFSVLIEDKGKRLLIDTPPDLWHQLNSLNIGTKDIDAIIITHPHYDHYTGLPEFDRTPRAGKIPILMTQSTNDIVSQHYNYALKGRSLYATIIPDKGDFQVLGFKAKSFVLEHLNFPVTGIILTSDNKKIALLVDTKPDIDPDFIEEAKGCDLLIIDAMADTELAKKRIIEEVHYRSFKDKEIESMKLSHPLMYETKEIVKDIRPRLAVGVHVSHNCAPQDELVKLHETDTFKIGYDNMEIEF